MSSNNDILTQLGQQWREEKALGDNTKESTASLISMASFTQLTSLRMHLSTIVILSITLAAIYSFYVWVANFQTTLSIVGGLMMVIALAARIGIEIVSLYLLTQIDVGLNAVESNGRNIRFHCLRRIIHGPFMYTPVTLYVIGFFLLTPEFLAYLSPSIVIIMDLSFIVGAIILVRHLKNCVREESSILEIMHQTQSELLKE